MRALRSSEVRDFPQVVRGKKHKPRLNPGHAPQHPPGPLRQTPAAWVAPPNVWVGPALVIWQRGPSAADFTLFHQGILFFDDKFIHHLFFSWFLNSRAKSFHSSDSLQPCRLIAHQAPLSIGFSRQEYCSGLPCSHLGDLPTHISCGSCIAGGFFTSEPLGSHWWGRF